MLVKITVDQMVARMTVMDRLVVIITVTDWLLIKSDRLVVKVSQIIQLVVKSY